MVDEVTSQLFHHIVGHSILTWSVFMLQVLVDVFHYVASHWPNTIIEASIAKDLQPSHDLFVM